MNKIIFFIIILCSVRLSAQQTLPITKVNNTLHKYGNRVDKLHNLEDLFQENERFKLLFDRFNKARKAQRTANIVFSSILVSSTFIVATSNCEDLECLGAAYLWIGANLLGASYAILANISAGSKKAKNKKELLRQFNRRSDLGMKTAPSLDLILSSNGIGLAYTF